MTIDPWGSETCSGCEAREVFKDRYSFQVGVRVRSWDRVLKEIFELAENREN